jgi:hypothetical protein
MSPKMILLRVGMLTAMLLKAASALPQEKEVQISITKLRTPSLYNCQSGKKADPQPWSARAFPWKAVTPNLNKGYFQVLDENDKPSPYCVKAFAIEKVETEQGQKSIPVEKECGTVIAQRTGATRGLGEDCPNTKAKGK